MADSNMTPAQIVNAGQERANVLRQGAQEHTEKAAAHKKAAAAASGGTFTGQVAESHAREATNHTLRATFLTANAATETAVANAFANKASQ